MWKRVPEAPTEKQISWESHCDIMYVCFGLDLYVALFTLVPYKDTIFN